MKFEHSVGSVLANFAISIGYTGSRGKYNRALTKTVRSLKGLFIGMHVANFDISAKNKNSKKKDGFKRFSPSQKNKKSERVTK